jgi:GNAT superfamily N-acetyltransferase
MIVPIQEYRKDNYTISTDPSRLRIDVIYEFLSRAYWSQGRSRQTVARSIENSLCFGVYAGDQQVGLGRVITDYSVYAHLCDVFILEAYRGHGLGKWLISCILAHPELDSARIWTLSTRDAHGLYRRFGFQEVATPGQRMEMIRD